MSRTDQQPPTLLERIAAGEPDAVDACIERYSKLVWSLARSLSPDPGTVEDVVQEIFVDVWKSAGRYDPSKSSEVTFIATIARRRVIDRRRRTWRQPETELVQDDSASVDDSTLARLEVEEEAGRALAAVQQLEPNKRKVLLLSIVDGLTHTQIADRTGMPLGTVKSHARRGLMKVAEMLRVPSPEASEGVAS